MSIAKVIVIARKAALSSLLSLEYIPLIVCTSMYLRICVAIFIFWNIIIILIIMIIMMVANEKCCDWISEDYQEPTPQEPDNQW